MPINPEIPLQVRPFRLDDPMDQALKFASLKTAQQQFTMEDDVGQAARESGGDVSKMADALLRRGQFAPAMQLRREQTNEQRQALQTQIELRRFSREEVEHGMKVAEAGGNDAIALDSMWRQALRESDNDPINALTKIQPRYSQVRSRWLKSNPSLAEHLPEGFDPDVNASLIGQAKESLQYFKSLQDHYGSPVPAVNPATGRTELYQPDRNTGDGRFTGVEPGATPAQPTELGRLMTERDAMAKANPQDSRLARYDEVIKTYKAGRGDTSVTLNNGPMLPGKAAANKVDEDILSATRGLMRIQQTGSQFKPEYQTIASKGGNWWNATKEKFGANLNAKERLDLTDFSAYRRNAIDGLNTYIKEITGAAMTNAEADRILKGMPNPGSGVFDGDSPTEFKAKMDDAIKQSRMAVARLAYIKRNGMSLTDVKGNAVIPLERMPDLMRDRAEQIRSELLKTNPKSSADARVKEMTRRLSLEFGVVP